MGQFPPPKPEKLVLMPQRKSNVRLRRQQGTWHVLRGQLLYFIFWGMLAPPQLLCFQFASQAAASSAQDWRRDQGIDTTQFRPWPGLSSKALPALRRASWRRNRHFMSGQIWPVQNLRQVLGGPHSLPTLRLDHSPGPSVYSGPVRLDSLNTVRLKFPSRRRTWSGSSMPRLRYSSQWRLWEQQRAAVPTATGWC